MNPPIYLISVLPGVAVWLISGHSHSEIKPALGLLIAATVAVTLIQHAVNLFNDAKDWQLGADTEKYDSWVRVHDEAPRVAIWHGTIALILGSVLGLTVLVSAGQLWVLSFTLPLFFLGLGYNAGKRPLSYSAWGEWVTGVCYGPGVFGGLWFAAGLPFEAIPLGLGMFTFAALATALLLSHQPPQIDTDRAAGKHTFAVRHGAPAARRAATRLHVASLISMTAAMGFAHDAPLITLAFAVFGLLAIMAVGCPGANPKRILLSSTTLYVVVSGIALLV
ncbi:MAG: prenyltransferase [Gammaproteobacteria bacterium]|nr:prenyltransferase [Gammaproteobacteria bacterium]MCP5135621.1 prenyltransferase [Gammaproteobacteria bacterium]